MRRTFIRRWGCVVAVSVSLLGLSTTATGGSAAAAVTGSLRAAAHLRTPAASSTSSYTFAYANVSNSSQLFDLVNTLIMTDGKKVGIKVDTFNNNLDASTALANARLMVQEAPNLAIDWTGVESVGASIGALFGRAKIPCIAVNQNIPGCPFFNLQNKFLGSGAASIVEPIMKQRGWNGKNTTVIFLFNPTAGAEVNSNGRYFYADVSKAIAYMAPATTSSITNSTTTLGSLPNLVQLNGADVLQTSYTATKQELLLLPADRNIIVFTQNDDSALGAWRAITEANRQKNTLIIGQGADPDGLNNLRTNPDWVAEGSVFFELWPEYLLAMGVAILHGAHPPALTLVPQTVLSKQNVATYYGAKGLHPIYSPPLPAVDQYLVKAGILQQFHNVPGL
jgi:ribose transport system substrate-binding protein